MKKNKKKLLVIILFALIVLTSVVLFVLHYNNSNKNSLTLEENKWIDSNKQDVIDISLMNDIPILSYDGNGLIYDYLDYVTKEYSLKFNIVPYKLDGSSEYNYKMNIVSEPSFNDIVLLKDNMVLINDSNEEYKNLENISDLTIGILSEDKDSIQKYFEGKNVVFKEFSTYSELKNVLISEENIDQTEKLDGIIILKTVFMEEMLENDYNISYQFNDLNKYFVLTTGGTTPLDGILSKSYNVWKEDNYDKSYNNGLLNNYFEFKKVSDLEQKTLKSKSYVYGFIDYGIYNYLDGDKISGLNGLILKKFNEFSEISITYTKYNSVNALLKDFNQRKVDFYFDIFNNTQYSNDLYKTVGIFNKDFVIISGINNDVVIDSINSLTGKEVLAVKDTYLEKLLIEKGMKVRSYNNLDDMAKDFKETDIAFVDLENYNYYKSSDFKDCRINYLINNNGKYNYTINNLENNNMFYELFDFYLNFTSINELTTVGYSDIAYDNTNFHYILIIITIILMMYLIIDFSNHLKFMLKIIKKNKKTNLSKEDKLKYIDQLTSLKNRAYLNSKIELWDDSEIYPQAIIVIDLNNVSYINDNYGREEGDKVITEAANVLIQHQLQNSEIIRTDGNEFLIYLVGYTEKQIISYLRKLNKELKTLSHGFGAASGYSIIKDAIKTIDDAINEATLDMKNNKDDIDY